MCQFYVEYTGIPIYVCTYLLKYPCLQNVNLYLTRNIFPINESNFLKQLQYVFTSAPTCWQLSYQHTRLSIRRNVYDMCVGICDIYASQCDKRPLAVCSSQTSQKLTRLILRKCACVCM